MKRKMYESEVKTAVLKITKVTKDSLSLSNVFMFGLAYIKLSKTFERLLKIRKSYSVLWDTLNRVTTFLIN